MMAVVLRVMFYKCMGVLLPLEGRRMARRSVGSEQVLGAVLLKASASAVDWPGFEGQGTYVRRA